MRKNILRVSEWVVNLGSLGLLVYIALALANPRRSKLPPRSAPLRPGHAVSISGVDWGKTRHTLVLALQTGCHFCAESAPFYKALLKEQTGSWQAIAVLPQTVEQSTAYMRAKGYSIAQIYQLDLRSIGVSGTPTLLLVDRNGKLEKEWVGKLQPSVENEVAQTLGVRDVAQNEPHLLLAGVGPSGFSLPSHGQSTTPVAEPQDTRRFMFVSYPDNPVQIVQVFEGNADVTAKGIDPLTGAPYKPAAGKPFEAGDDWLQNIVLVVKNLSDKQVTAVDLRLTFPQTGTGKTPDSPVVATTITIGQKPSWALYTRSGRQHTPIGSELEPFSIPPGQEVRIALAKFYSAIKSAIESKQPISTINAVYIGSQFYYFADGTRWTMGNFEKPDPGRPGAYTRITREAWKNSTTIN
ncbi:MAG: TlpA family protein disulfide reductase [Candidatus Acidiferrales bacterium]